MLDFVSHMFWWFHSSVLEILVAIGALDSLYSNDVVVCGHLIRRGSLSVKMHVDVFDRLHQVPKKILWSIVGKEVGFKHKTRRISYSTFGSIGMRRAAAPTIGDRDDWEDDLARITM